MKHCYNDEEIRDESKELNELKQPSSAMELLMKSVNNEVRNNETLKTPKWQPKHTEEDFLKSKNSKTAALFYKHGKLEDFDKSKSQKSDEVKKEKKSCCFPFCKRTK